MFIENDVFNYLLLIIFTDTLKVLAMLCGNLLQQKVNKQRPLLRNQKGCDDLICYLQKLDINPI